MSEEKHKDINQLLKDIEIRSEDVQEIMGFIPHWIIRWGITVIFLVIASFLVGSWLFKYPDVISSNIVLTTENPPANLVARTSGKITELFVRDKQQVREGEFIAIIENATNHQHLFRLKEQLESLRSFFTYFDSPADEQFDQTYSLGELQSPYAAFLKSYADYQHFIKLNYHQKKINSTKAQIRRHNLLYEQLHTQTQITEQELKLSEVQFQRAKELYNEGIISESEFETAKSINLQKKYAHEGAKTSMSNSKIQINQLEQSVMELELQYREDKKRYELALSQAYENLTGRIAQWEQMYLLKAPISGTVTFTKYWSVNQNVTAGDKVVTIVPEQGGKIIGKVVLPLRGSGKVKLGQKVNIKFTNYPHMDYGIVTGIIKSKSLVASDNFYSLEVDLPKGLFTSYGKTLEFSQEMQGSAEIITEDIRLLERFFKPIKSILKKMQEPSEEK
ncbi:MAG: HlyD family efflux transporter periplasmic adaptor subunit [Candidatus Aminicenantes bacterium]|nr:MAG: HlyD family efflux transporter periplasmic adaptor subunit [Candidatus Aminicenantes bacterium]